MEIGKTVQNNPQIYNSELNFVVCTMYVNTINMKDIINTKHISKSFRWGVIDISQNKFTNPKVSSRMAKGNDIPKLLPWSAMIRIQGVAL